MGQKVSPTGLRLGIVEEWRSQWYADSKKYSEKVEEDFKIRTFLKKELYKTGVSKIEIERVSNNITVNIHTARSAIVIGKGGKNIDQLKDKIIKTLGLSNIHLNVSPVQIPEVSAQLVAERIANQLERRVAFRRAMKKAIEIAMKRGAEGIKTSCSGRLGGAEMARTEWYKEGRVPLHTFRAKIDYGTAVANTKFGKVGVKVWICNGEVID